MARNPREIADPATSIGGPGTCVLSAVRPDGVGRATTEVPPAPIGVEPDVLEGAIQTAIESLDVLERHAHELADSFRWNQIADANRGLADLMQSTQTMLMLASVTAGVVGADLEALCADGSQHADEDTRLAVCRLIECEEARDWPALADTLDRALVPALAQWRFVFEAMHVAPPPEPLSAA